MQNYLLRGALVVALGSLLSACGGGSTTSDNDARECVSIDLTSVDSASRIVNSCPFDVNILVLNTTETFGPALVRANSTISLSGTAPEASNEGIIGVGACRVPAVPSRISDRGIICQN